MQTTEWQLAAINDAARRYPRMGSKNDREIYLSMRDESVTLLPVGSNAPDGYIRIDVLGVLQVKRQPLIDAIMAMDDENFKYNMNGRYNIHINTNEFKNARTIEADTPSFVQEGNRFDDEAARYMLSIDCDAFIDEGVLWEMGGGVPTSSEIADARKEADDPDDWIESMMKEAEKNIRAALQPIILFDDDVEGDSIQAILVDYVEVK